MKKALIHHMKVEDGSFKNSQHTKKDEENSLLPSLMIIMELERRKNGFYHLFFSLINASYSLRIAYGLKTVAWVLKNFLYSFIQTVSYIRHHHRFENMKKIDISTGIIVFLCF